MIISESLKFLKKENKVLYWSGWLNAALFILAFILFFVDDRQIMSINAWIKPMKFALSVLIYVWTFGWLLQYLPAKNKGSFISWGITICMIVENIAIFFQAARGEISHYNISSALNASIFSAMGIFISINSILIFYTMILFFTEKINLDKASLFAWRAGLFLVLVGGAAGGMMISNMAHTVGAPDGGPGLPFLNWSTVAGDLRVAHFLTLHGLQAIPLFSLLIASKTSKPMLYNVVFFICYTGACVALHLFAMQGRPFSL
ncbi:MAG: hypothetical protein JSU09_17660 [Bacteroidetes bacterium]|nr:hypothetical protein [Bacteroidota bacterium]